MRLLIIILTVLTFGQLCSQSADDYVKAVEKLRSKGKLTTKASTDKTFVGSVKAYYDKDSLVLINSLTDGEAAGTETLYFLKDGVLKKVFIMRATFDSSDEWGEYGSRHNSINKCYSCHGKPNCIVTVITFDDDPTIVVTDRGKTKQLTKDEKTKIIGDVVTTRKELDLLLKEL